MPPSRSIPSTIHIDTEACLPKSAVYDVRLAWYSEGVSGGGCLSHCALYYTILYLTGAGGSSSLRAVVGQPANSHQHTVPYLAQPTKPARQHRNHVASLALFILALSTFSRCHYLRCHNVLRTAGRWWQRVFERVAHLWRPFFETPAMSFLDVSAGCA